MKGLEISDVKLSQVVKTTKSRRMDAEFFKKEYLIQDENLQKKDLNKLSDITTKIDVGFVGSMTANYVDEYGVKLLQTKNISEFLINTNSFTYVDAAFHEKLQKSQVFFEDILIARSGSFGKASIYLEDEVVNSSDIIIINADRRIINPYYLTTYLNSTFGVNQMIRFASGGIQGHINLAILEELLVPIPSYNFQNIIEQFIKTAYTKLQESKIAYFDAETLFLDALDLNADTLAELQAPLQTVNANVKSFTNSFLSSGRLDSEFYQTKYERLEQHLSRYDKIKVSDLVDYPVSSGSTPKAGGTDYTDFEFGVPFIRAVDLQNSYVSTNNLIYIKPEVHQSTLKKTRLKKGDVLISIAGTVGRCALFNHNFEANINQAVAIMRFKERSLLRLYVVTFFNSEVGQMYIAKYARQGLQTNLNLSEVSDLEIPMISTGEQKNISDRIEDSFLLSQESQRLLGLAKRAVEVAIEEGEEQAMALIESHEY